MDRKQTVGQISYDLLQKKPYTLSPVEQMREQLTDYEREVINCAMDNRHKMPKEDFYIVVLTKKERLMPNVLRNYFFARVSCPTPDYDQAVYRYDTKDEDIEFLWVIPSKDTCELMKLNALMIHPSEKELLKYVLEFYDGTLMKTSKKLNGESKNSPIIEG